MLILETIQELCYVCSDKCPGGGFPLLFVKTIRIALDVVKIIAPLLLIIFGMLDMAKAVAAQKQDEIKKGQQTLIKRAIAAAAVYLVVAFVEFIINVIGDDSNDSWSCASCVIGDSEECGTN